MKKKQLEPVSTYLVYVTNTKNVWEFVYNLDGFIQQFSLIEGNWLPSEIKWLFLKPNFPYKEEMLKQWQKEFANLKVEVTPADLTFELFYELYAYKVSPKPAEKAWLRTTKANRLLAVKKIKEYKAYLSRHNKPQQYPATYLNQQTYLSEFNKY